MKNYYVILGVPRACSQQDIKKAYRQLARQYHPDVTKTDDANRFQDIQEAYETIGDREKRKHYDDDLNHETDAKKELFHFGDDNLFYRMWEDSGSFFSGKLKPDLEIILNEQEAHNGCVIPLEIPVNAICPVCEGRSASLFFFEFCSLCWNTGGIEKEISFKLRIPPGVEDMSLIQLSFNESSQLKILIRIR